MRIIYLVIPFFCLLFACNAASDQGFVAYPVGDGAVQSSDFSLKSGEEEIFLSAFKTYHYAHLEWSTALDLRLESEIPVSDFEISPERAGIKGTLNGDAVQFKLDRPGYYMVRINEDHRIFIFLDEPMEAPVEALVNIMDYDVDASGATLVTSQLQKAVDDISGSGKVLLFPEGTYKTGTLTIGSDTKIHLSPGAMIKGPDDLEYFGTEDNVRPKPIILIRDAKNVEISGRGILDGNGTHLQTTYGQEGKGRLVLILNSEHVTLDGIFLRDPPSWNTHILYSKDVSIRNIKMLNDMHISNTDGFDPDASQGVVIENCFAICGDDNVAIKSTGNMDLVQDVSDITIRNNVFLTKKSALKVGTESNAANMKNILFENNEVLESDRGMTLYCYDGAIYENISYINNHFERSYPDRCQCGIHFRIRKREDWSRAGIMRQILIKDCSFSRALPNMAQMTGMDQEHNIELVIDNMTIDGAPCTPENEENWLEQRFVDISYK